MNIELLSVVDRNDRVIDTLPRHVIHELGLRHRAVHVLVFNTEGNLFLQKRSMKKDLNKGLWDTSAAGHVDLNEEYDYAAIRETQEELGVDVSQTLSRLFKLEPTTQLGMEFVQVYQCRHEGDFKLNIDEIEKGDWFTNKEISLRVNNNDHLLTDTFKTIWLKYLASLDKNKVDL